MRESFHQDIQHQEEILEYNTQWSIPKEIQGV